MYKFLYSDLLYCNFEEYTLSNITLINYTTRDFISKAELELFISKQDIYYTKEVIAKFKKAGMVRRVVTKIWNRDGAFRVGILFEYTDEKAYKVCQDLLDKHILPHFKDFNTKVVGSRGIVVHEF